MFTSLRSYVSIFSVVDSILLLLSLLVAPVLVNKSTEGEQFDWVKPYLRPAWTAFFIVWFCYALSKTPVEVFMTIRKFSPWLVYPILAVAGAVILCGYYWAMGRMLREGHRKVKQPLADLQKHLQIIDDFIATKDENELRELFDFPDILKYNLRFAKRNLFPSSVSKQQSEDIDRFFVDGKGRLDVRFARVSNVNNRVEVEWLPGRIGVINTSVKYTENRHKLVELYSSAQVPAAIAVALKELDDAIEKDSTLMIESLNESLAPDPRTIFENEQVGTRFYGSASGLYWSHFISLSPKADAVRLWLRDYLNVK